MSPRLLVMLALPVVAACGSEPEEEEMPVVESEVFVPSEDVQQADTLPEEEASPIDRSLANEAEDSVTAPASEATGKIQPIE